ncbi:MAG: type II secretion system F family protein [Victivallales bacterium]|nr:type II secretion system F family protein [Victivallales bacterium]
MGEWRDRSQFYFTLATVVDAGASPVSALRHEFLGKFRKAAVELYPMVSDGSSLSSAMSNLPLFSRFECVFVAIGERSGKLSMVLRTLGEWFDVRHSMRQHIISGMLYPVFLFYMAGIVFTVINYFTKGRGLGSCLLGLGIWSSLPIIAYIVFRILLRQMRSSSSFGRILNHVPILGDIFFKQESMTFFKALGMCLSSGMGMAYSLRNAGSVCGSAYYRKRYGVLSDVVERAGCPLSTAFRRMGLTSRERQSVIMTCLETGEQTGTLDQACERIAEIHRDDSTRQMNRISRTLPMLFYLIIVLYIGIRVISFFAGYVNAINELME